MKKLNIIKIGGKVIDDENALMQFLHDFADISGPKILVHGGGKTASDFGARLGVLPKMIDGRRITDAQTLELVIMVYGGLVNKRLVSQLQSSKVNAIGLTGADGNVIHAVKRPVEKIDYGFAGDVTTQSVNAIQLAQFVEMGLTPVLCALTHDGKGSLLNTNADTIASVVAGALAPSYEVDLIYCFEHNGVLKDIESQSVIDTIDTAHYESLKRSGVISEGMIPKMDNAFDALKSGVKSVVIGNYSQVQILVEGGTSGTKIQL